MTIAEEILRAAAALVGRGLVPFGRDDIRKQIGFPPNDQRWKNSYNPVIQGMREAVHLAHLRAQRRALVASRRTYPAGARWG